MSNDESFRGCTTQDIQVCFLVLVHRRDAEIAGMDRFFLLSVEGTESKYILPDKVFGCVISHLPSTTYELYALLRVAPSSLAKNII